MRHYPALIILLVFGSLAFSQQPDIELVNAIPSNFGTDFRCEKMIRVVNHLRGLGKDKALEILLASVKESPLVSHENILWICRLLFINTNAWNFGPLGTPDPALRTNPVARFAIFPMVLSQGVPFELVVGYRGDGFFGNPPSRCIEYCAGLPLISADLVNTNYESAARALIKSPEFQQLYKNPDDAKMMALVILHQAGVTNIPNFINRANGSIWQLWNN